VSERCEVLIVGGGPGGLAAAIYLRRFRREVILVDKGNSRLSLIPISHNYPGFPGGVPGRELLGNLRAQFECYGGEVREGEVTALRKEGDIFIAECGEREILAPAVLLASGVADEGSRAFLPARKGMVGVVVLPLAVAAGQHDVVLRQPRLARPWLPRSAARAWSYTT
jgi:thioredoxin reductase